MMVLRYLTKFSIMKKLRRLRQLYILERLRKLTKFNIIKTASWSSLQEITAIPSTIARNISGAVGDIGIVIGNRTQRWHNPFTYRAVRAADALDKKIDPYNQQQWAKNPDPTSNSPIYVNRGSTFSRNGHPLRLNLKGLPGISHATAIDLLDALHRDPATTHLAPPSISHAPSVIFQNNSMGVPNPLGRKNVGHVWLQPWADPTTLVHETGHNRSYGTRSSRKVWKDALRYLCQRPIATMRMEDLAEDNGWRLNSLMNTESRMAPEQWARHSDHVLCGYSASHDPKKTYLNSLTRPSEVDGRDRYTPLQHSGLPGQPNWHRSEYYRKNPEVLDSYFR